MRISRRIVFVITFATMLISAATVAQEKTPANDNTPKYRNPKLAIENRVTDLLSRMTLEEKVGQVAPSGKPASVIDPTGTFTNETAQANTCAVVGSRP
jgi:hypothetical protein